MYYIGFLKNDPNHAVLFKSVKVPTKTDYRFFVSVSGPYESWRSAKYSLAILKRRDNVKENPIKGLVTKEGIRKAVGLTKKAIKIYGIIRQKNPGENYHTSKFLRYMTELNKYVVGSKEYIAVLAKAYEHLESARVSVR